MKLQVLKNLSLPLMGPSKFKQQPRTLVCIKLFILYSQHTLFQTLSSHQS